MDEKKLIQAALKARQNAYVPYSRFKVGAAILLKNGQIITGANIENASYPLSNCAERSALFSAYSQGYQKQDIVAMAVVADTLGPVSPCGACRQVMLELLGEKTPIILSNLAADMQVTYTPELLPYGFKTFKSDE